MNIAPENRLNLVHQAMAEMGADALVLTHLPNIFYLCGFSGSNAILLVLGDAIYLFTDGRYTIQAQEEAPQTRLRIVRAPLAEACGQLLEVRSSKKRMRIAFEAASLNVAEWSRLKKAAGRKITWKATNGLVEGIREVKTVEELDLMRRSARLAS